jgi:hypothetical protein
MKNQGENQNHFGLACLRETELGVENDIVAQSETDPGGGDQEKITHRCDDSGTRNTTRSTKSERSFFIEIKQGSYNCEGHRPFSLI